MPMLRPFSRRSSSPYELGDVIGLGRVPPFVVNAVLYEVEAD